MIPPEISIQAENLSKSFGPIHAIEDISFEIYKGEVIGLLGPNGAGKSTTMRILCGLVEATSGSAYIGGISVVENPESIKKLVGYMPENNPLPEELRVIEYLRYRARLKGIAAHEINNRVEEVLETCDLHHKARRRIIRSLSKGFRQRVGIADTLLTHPEIVIMDEPTIGLDPHQTKIIRDLINSRRGRMTFIISSHILPEVELLCDRILIINQGRIVAQGKSCDLRHEYVPGNSWRISTTGENEKLRNVLLKLDPDAELPEDPELEACPLPNSFVFKTRNLKITGDQIIQAIQKETDATLTELAHLEPSLEEIFLAATKRSWEATLSRKPTAVQ
jgi:ABC-2 type transport system ATP-binding protein